MARTLYLDNAAYSPARLMDVPWGGREAKPLRLKRGDAGVFHVYFCEDGVTVDPPDGATVSFQAKRLNAAKIFSNAPVLVAADAELADGDSRKYLAFTPDWDDAETLDTLLSPTYDGEPGEVVLRGEISWDDGGTVSSTEGFDVVVLNDVVKALADTPD